MRAVNLLLGILVLVSALIIPPAAAMAAPRQAAPQINVQEFLDRQPGVLKRFRDADRTAAQIIQGYATYYNLDPRVPLTLLELGPNLLSVPQPPDTSLQHPFGAAGPDGFTAQIEWAVREIRAGFGPYTAPPVVKFADGTSATLDTKQEPSVVAVQRFLAQGRTQPEWRAMIDRFVPLYTKYWGDEPSAPTPTPATGRPFLRLPWPAGVEMIHSSYFDHVYPTVDRGEDDNSFIVNYLGRGNLSYNTHDGHDYYFPAKPIGTPILAAAPGVAYAYTTRGNGVVIRHGGEYAGYETVYWHLDQFARIFQGKIDNGVGVPVAAGAVLGTSGKSGFTDGGAHLHFEVRHNGKQVDPYGWYGPGSDPCAAWKAGCEASVWLWHESLNGTYDFDRPDTPAPQDREPPVGSLAVAPDADLGLLAHFDRTLVPTVGRGFPQVNGAGGAKPAFEDGVFDAGVQVPQPVELTYPISGNLELDRGTIALWAKLPQQYPANSTKRHYLFAASGNPETGDVYTDTLALRHEQTDDGAMWNFWTVDSSGKANNLATPDTLAGESWHHFAVTWDREAGSKALLIDGAIVTQTSAISLPTTLGDRLQLGRFVASFGTSGAVLDELAVFRRALSEREIKRLADRQDVYTQQPGPILPAQVVTDRTVLLDANAIDAQGGIVSVELRRDAEPWSEPLPYHDSYRWTISGTEGLHTFAIRYRDRADNATVVTTTLELQASLHGSADVRSTSDTAAVLGLAVDVPAIPVDGAAPAAWLADNIEMQLSEYEDFRDAVWEPFADTRVWNWRVGQKREVYVRFRDRQGRISSPAVVGPDVSQP